MVRQVISLFLLSIFTVVINGAEPGRKTTIHPVEQYLDSHGRTLSIDAVEAKLSPRTRHVKALGTSQILKPADQQDDVLWTLTHVDDNAEYYLGSGDSLDTFAVVFTPAEPCVVTEVYVQWYTAGDVIAYAADYSPAAEAISPDGECSDIARGSIDFSPIGTPRTPPTLNHIDGYHADWTYPLDIGGAFIVGDSSDLSHIPPFVIVLIKQGPTPNPLADSIEDQDSLTYTWFGGPWTDNQWGRYSDQTDLSMLVKVLYFREPGVVWWNYLPNTYNRTGPFRVFADFFDSQDTSGFAIDESDTIAFHWKVNDGPETMDSLRAYQIEPDGSGLYYADIIGEFNPGDVITYWVTWETAIDPWILSPPSSFQIKQPDNPYADILLIADRADQNQLAANLYGQTLFDMNLVYEFWDTGMENGIDSSVVNYGWRNIIMFGDNRWSLPVTNYQGFAGLDPRFDQFLDNGNRLALINQNGVGSGPTETLQFIVGDFAYDYFGLVGAVRSPKDSNNVSIADTAIIGAGVTPIDSGFVSSPIHLNHAIYGTTNRSDYLTPGTATPIFTGANDGQCYGVINTDGNFHTVYLSFMADAAVDTLADGTLVSPQFTELLQGIIHWFNVVIDATDIENIRPTEFNLLPNYPNPFNPSTQIEFSVPQIETVSITIYNLRGQQVTQLVSREYQPGSYTVSWNGRDATGKPVAAGTYFYKMEAGDFIQTRKMVYLK